MGGLFFEAPPFGLFMFSMVVVLFLIREKGLYTRWTSWGITFAVLGVLFSLADQVLLAATVGLLFSLPRMGKKHPRIAWPLAIIVTIAVCAFEFQSITVKESLRHHRHRDQSQRRQCERAKLSYSLWAATCSRLILQRAFLVSARDAMVSMRARPGISRILSTCKHRSWSFWWSGVSLGLPYGLRSSDAWLSAIWEVNGVLGFGLLLGLILADSFQANWKYEAVFLAVGALSCGGRTADHVLWISCSASPGSDNLKTHL